MADSKQQTGMTRHEEQTRAVAIGREGVLLRSMDDLKSFALMACGAGMFPHFTKPEALALAVIWGQEIGISPIQALNHIAIIKGRPVLWGPVPMAICIKSGVLDMKRHKEYIVGKPGSADFAAVVETARIGGPVTRVIFSWDDAKKAGLTSKDTYTSYPSDMLLNRARSRALKRVFPDVLMGCGVATVAGNNAATEADIVEDDGPARINSLSDLPPIDGEVVSNWGSTREEISKQTEIVVPEQETLPEGEATDEEILAALADYVDTIATREVKTEEKVCETLLGFTIATPDGEQSGHPSSMAWFNAFKDTNAGKHAARMKVARDLAKKFVAEGRVAFKLEGTP